LAVGSNSQFKKLLEVLNLKNIVSDIRFIENNFRVQNRKALNIFLKTEIEQQNSDQLQKKFINLNIPAGIIKDMSEVFENPLTEKLILKEKIESTETVKLKTVIFEIK